MLRKSFPPNLCRLCGLDKSEGVDVCSPSAKKAGLLQKINKRLSKEGVHIAIGDGLPKFVCSDCEVIINDFTEFCKMVHRVQKRLEDEKLGFEEISHKAVASAAASTAPMQKEFKNQQKVTDIGCTVTENNATVSVGPDGKVECKLCRNYLEAVEHTTLHMVTHGIGTVISCCRNCGHQGELAQFLRCSNGREEKNSVWCENCQFQPTSKTKGNSEPKTKRTNQRNHHCEICSKVFRTKAHLNRHQIVHSGAKPFLCEVCGTGFSQKSSLKLHVLKHAGVNPHKCEQCGQSFRFKVSMRSHMMSLHWPNGSSNAATSDCIHRCDHCGKQFATAYKLSRHYRCHTGERPYECDQCGRLFSQSCNLNLHRKKHEGRCLPDRKETSTDYRSVLSKNHLSDALVRKTSTEQYRNPILSQQPNNVQQTPVPFVRETTEVLDDTHDPKEFLETILQQPVVPSLDEPEAPLTSIDTVLLHSSEKNAEHSSQFVPLSSQFGSTSSHLTPEYLGIGTETDNKNLQGKSDSDLFPHFSDDELLYIDQTSNLQAPPSADNVALPTFSSLQSGPVSISNISH